MLEIATRCRPFNVVHTLDCCESLLPAPSGKDADSLDPEKLLLDESPAGTSTILIVFLMFVIPSWTSTALARSDLILA